MNQVKPYYEASMTFSTAENRPRIIYTIKELGKEDRTIASPMFDMSNPKQTAYALRVLADMIEEPWINPVE